MFSSSSAGSDAGDIPRDSDGLPAFAADGTDLTVIRWFLRLTPAERLRWLDRQAQVLARAHRERADT